MNHEGLEKRLDDLVAQMRQGFEANDRRFDGIDQRFDEQSETLRRHMDIIAERLEAKFQLVIESHIVLRDRVDAHDRRFEDTDKKVDGLDLRVTHLEHRDR